MPAPLNILVVDDNAEVLATIRELLLLHGYRVRAFTEGAAAVADFRRAPADMVITDLGMPEVTGWQVAGAVRQMSATTPIVFITAVSERLDEDALRQLGIAEVLRKPFRISQISRVLHMLSGTETSEKD